MSQSLIRVAVTGGAGQIAYNLLFRIASGEMFGQEVPVALHILEIPQMESALEGVVMELNDCAFPALKEIVHGTDAHHVFKDVDWALLVGASPRSKGMQRNDLLAQNAKVFIDQGKALNKVAKESTKVLVVGNPCNTNCWITMKCAPKLNPKNFHALTRLDQNRGAYQLASKAGVDISDVERMLIWGNHSATQVPDFLNAQIHKKPVKEVIQDHKWLENEFIQVLQQRGAAIIEARGRSSAASAANAVIDAVQSLQQPTESGQWYSDCVLSDGNPYGIEDDLIFSFPCTSSGEGNWDFVHGLQMDTFLKDKLETTQQELKEEREYVKGLIKEEK